MNCQLLGSFPQTIVESPARLIGQVLGATSPVALAFIGHGSTMWWEALLSSGKMLTRGRCTPFSLCVPTILGLILGICCAPGCASYSVLTHEAIIDAAWKDSIEPLLLQRFPNATLEELLQAHALCLPGGAIIQDMGYYPFGNRFFSDLTHYVRSGDFVLALIDESRDLNEYSFRAGCIGALRCASNRGTRWQPIARLQ